MTSFAKRRAINASLTLSTVLLGALALQILHAAIQPVAFWTGWTLFALVFALGAMLAGLAGMLVAPLSEASIGMGNNIIITAFVVIIVGGIGSMKGAFIGALVIGLIDTLGRSYIDDFFKIFMSYL